MAAAKAQDEADAVIKAGVILRKKKRQREMILSVKDPMDDKSTPVLLSRNDPCLPWCFLGAHVRVQGTMVNESSSINGSDTNNPSGSNNQQKRERNDGSRCQGGTEQQQHLVPTTPIQLAQCAPDPIAVAMCLDLVAVGQLPLQVFPCFSSDNQVAAIRDLTNKNHRRKAIAQVVRQLQGKDPERVACKRQPHTRQRHVRILGRLEALVELQPIHHYQRTTTCTRDEEGGADSDSSQQNQIQGDISSVRDPVLGIPVITTDQTPLNIPDQDSRRVGYLQDKKWPQIQYILDRLEPIMNNSANHTAPLHVLDVGGGRGDLGTAIARRFANQLHVTIVDINESSLQAGREYARQLGMRVSANEKQSTASDEQSKHGDDCHIGDQDDNPQEQLAGMTFLCRDFADYVREYATPTVQPVDIVVALHACGDLSDLALMFARHICAPFVICPCCYTKRYIRALEQPDFARLYCQRISGHINANEDSSTSNISSTVLTEQNSGAGKPAIRFSPEEEISIVQRLAELNERPELGQRARHVINSLRLNAFQQANAFQTSDAFFSAGTKADDDDNKRQLQWMLRLEAYENTFSKRNMVLVGELKPS